jgi:hypothetical protein
MNRTEIISLIDEMAEKHGLEAGIVYGVCMQESQLNFLAVRYEPHYRWLWKPQEVRPRICSLETERTLQKMSFGLMQVMGAVFREYGFSGWLTNVVSSPRVQVEYGCKHLAKKIQKYGPDKGILAYNSGSPRKNAAGEYVNQYYLDNVLKYQANF